MLQSTWVRNLVSFHLPPKASSVTLLVVSLAFYFVGSFGCACKMSYSDSSDIILTKVLDRPIVLLVGKLRHSQHRHIWLYNYHWLSGWREHLRVKSAAHHVRRGWTVEASLYDRSDPLNVGSAWVTLWGGWRFSLANTCVPQDLISRDATSIDAGIVTSYSYHACFSWAFSLQYRPRVGVEIKCATNIAICSNRTRKCEIWPQFRILAASKGRTI